jgi:hypothetical protein
LEKARDETHMSRKIETKTKVKKRGKRKGDKETNRKKG